MDAQGEVLLLQAQLEALAGNRAAAQQLLQTMQCCVGDVAVWATCIGLQAGLLEAAREGARPARKLLEAGIGMFGHMRCDGAQPHGDVLSCGTLNWLT